MATETCQPGVSVPPLVLEQLVQHVHVCSVSHRLQLQTTGAGPSGRHWTLIWFLLTYKLVTDGGPERQRTTTLRKHNKSETRSHGI